jgi:hypothetical protein
MRNSGLGPQAFATQPRGDHARRTAVQCQELHERIVERESALEVTHADEDMRQHGLPRVRVLGRLTLQAKRKLQLAAACRLD